MHGRMHGRMIRSIAALSAASLIAQPLFAVPSEKGGGGVAQACTVSVSPAIMVSDLLIPLLPIAVLPVSALSPAMIEAQRGAIAEIMIKLGEDEDRARQMATELTAEDLAVLLANPKMMQKAGDLALIVIVVVIVGGIVALALAADSSTVIINA